MDDHCVVNEIDNNKVKFLLSLIENDDTIDKIMLHPFMWDGVEKLEHELINVYLYPEEGVYRTSLMNAVWKTDYFKKYLNLNMTPWEFEGQNNQGRNDGRKILTTDDKMIMISSLMYGGGRINESWSVDRGSKYSFKTPSIEFIIKINEILNKYRNDNK